MNLSTVSSLFKKTMQREKKIICDYYDTQKKYEVFFRRDNRSTSPQGKMRLYYENSQGIQIGTIYNYKNKNYLVVSQDAQESEVYYTSLAVRCDTEIDITYTYNIPYMEQVEIESFCKKYHISNSKLFCDYVSTAKSILKKMFLRALAAMKKQGQVEYEDGFMFTYKLGEISLGHFCTDELNEIIKKNETRICDEMNEKYKLSSKMSGRQLLLLIYHNEAYTNEFNEKKVSALMEDQSALTIMEKCIDGIESDVGTYCGRTYIDDEHPLLSYYRGIAIEEIDDLQDMKDTGTDICNAVCIKARQEVLNKHYKNKRTGRMVYPYDKFECAGDIKKTEKLLFNFYDENLVDDTALDFVEVDEELEALFGQKEKEVWGEPEPDGDEEEIERIFG